MQCFDFRYVKGLPFVCHKWNIKWYGFEPHGKASPYKPFLITSPPPPPPPPHSRDLIFGDLLTHAN